MNRKPWNLYDLRARGGFSNASSKDEGCGGYLINWRSINSHFTFLPVICTENTEDLVT
jgi:hypothetical protein